MFSIEKDASKISLVYLAAHLIEGGFKFIDTQFYSDHLKQFGTKKSLGMITKNFFYKAKQIKNCFQKIYQKTYLITLAELFFFQKYWIF